MTYYLYSQDDELATFEDLGVIHPVLFPFFARAIEFHYREENSRVVRIWEKKDGLWFIARHMRAFDLTFSAEGNLQYNNEIHGLRNW